LSFFVLAAFAALPIWIVAHPPLQDLPAHLATLRVIHDYGNPAYGFEADYRTLWQTTYALYYAVGSALSHLVGVRAANALLISAYLAGSPLALRALLRSLGKDERLAIFGVPLAFNKMFMLGLLPFVMGIPLMIATLALALRDLETPTRLRGAGIALLSVVLFGMHVFPFAVFGVAYVIFFPWTAPRRWLRAALPMLPAIGCVSWWLASEAGRAAASGGGPHYAVAPLDEAISGVWQWTTNVFKDTSDERWTIAVGLVALAAHGLATGDRDRRGKWTRRHVLLVLVCVVAYFTLGDRLGDVWLLAQRVPAMAAFLAVPLLRWPRSLRGHAMTVALAAVAIGTVVNVCNHFVRFEREEVGPIEEAIASMEPRKHVAGLVFDRESSNVVYHSPLLHFTSYYQVEKGGVVTPSFAGYPHWPVQYKPGRAPPEAMVAVAAEWHPELARAEELRAFYDYVLVRGEGFSPGAAYHVHFHRDRWTVYARN
jgi:hypothetical protein